MTPMTGHERILLDFRGGPRDGSRRDLGESTDGKWPLEYVIERWPLADAPTTSVRSIRGRYVRTDEWTANVEARIYVWQPEVRVEG
jgi:hypothetical protein